MPSGRTMLAILGGGLALALAGWWWLRPDDAPSGEMVYEPGPPPEDPGAPPTPASVANRPPLAFAGAPTPELNQISVAQDLRLASEVFGPGGYVLFGAGPGSPSVQVIDHGLGHDPVRSMLAELFAPRGGREARYETAELDIDAPADRDQVLDALQRATEVDGDPLLVWIGGHGRHGATPREYVIDLWGHGELRLDDLAPILDASRREVRLVSTTCFAGGLAELAFAGADESAGAAPTVRCGLFAAPWDLEATGCDPNPDRAAQEGYALHVLHALRGQDRDGEARPPAELDLDHDGAISLLEAHTRVRLEAKTADVPTTTSERWLRQVAPSRGRGVEVALPEEEAVIRTLARRLGLEGHEEDAVAELHRRESAMQDLLDALDAAQTREDEAYRTAAAEILARWPVLDDPWHPRFDPTLARSGPAIRQFLDTSPSHAAYTRARDEVDRLGGEIWEARLAAAPYERLVRAVETRQLAARLHAKGGADWRWYETLLACERAAPPAAP